MKAFVGGLVLVMALAACNLVAGLDQFQPASSKATSAGGSSTTSSGTKASSTKSATSTSSKSTTQTSSVGAPCGNRVLINEVDLQDGWIELWNPSSTEIPISTFALSAHGTSMNLVPKWSGMSTQAIPANGYWVLGTGGDASLSTPLSKTADPMVVVLYDGTAVIDSLCVCGPSCNPDPSVSAFCQSPVQSPALFNPSGGISVGRMSCVDTGNNAADFVEQCPTLGAPNMGCAG